MMESVITSTTSSYVITAVDKVKNFWNTFEFKKWTESFGGSSAEAIQAAVFFGLFFSIGFLLKKHFRLIIACIVVTLFTIKILETAALITIDWNAIKALLGLDPQATLGTAINLGFAWIKRNFLIFIASSLGLLIGYKLG